MASLRDPTDFEALLSRENWPRWPKMWAAVSLVITAAPTSETAKPYHFQSQKRDQTEQKIKVELKN